MADVSTYTLSIFFMEGAGSKGKGAWVSGERGGGGGRGGRSGRGGRCGKGREKGKGW